MRYAHVTSSVEWNPGVNTIIVLPEDIKQNQENSNVKRPMPVLAQVVSVVMALELNLMCPIVQM